jgi:hypothetical protein
MITVSNDSGSASLLSTAFLSKLPDFPSKNFRTTRNMSLSRITIYGAAAAPLQAGGIV